MPTFLRKPANVQAVQWTGDDASMGVAICALHADSELVAFREDDGTVSIETTGRTGARCRLATGSSRAAPVTSPSARPDAFAANYEPV